MRTSKSLTDFPCFRRFPHFYRRDSPPVRQVESQKNFNKFAERLKRP